LKIPFHRPILPDDLNQLFDKSLRDGWLTTGPIVKAFESELSDFLNAKHVIAVNSCTAALHLALASQRFQINDKFIAPTYTFVSSVEVGEYMGMRPILVDSEIDEFNFDLNHVESELKRDNEIKAIIPVHFGGKPVQMSQVFFLAEKYNLFVLEDAAHALESYSDVGKVGNTDYATAFSFYANKNITTGGEGGALSTNDSILAEKIRKLSLHGMSKDGYKRFQAGGKWMYDISDLGYKYNMTDISASFGLWQFRHLDEWHDRRITIFNKYCNQLSKIDGIICPKSETNSMEAYHLFPIQIVPEAWNISRNKLIIQINDKGIGTSVHYIPIHMHSYYHKKYGYSQNDFPNAKRLSESVITLPLYPSLKDDEIDYIIKILLKLWSKHQL